MLLSRSAAILAQTYTQASQLAQNNTIVYGVLPMRNNLIFILKFIKVAYIANFCSNATSNNNKITVEIWDSAGSLEIGIIDLIQRVNVEDENQRIVVCDDTKHGQARKEVWHFPMAHATARN